MKITNKSKIILLIPYPAQGHVNPMIKPSLALKLLGFEPKIIIPEFIYERITKNNDPNTKNMFMPISDGLENEMSRDFFSIEKALENHIPNELENIVRKFDEDGGGEVVCMIVDLLASSAIHVGDKCGVPVAGFWPAMFATYQLIEAIPDMVNAGIISETGNPEHPSPISFLPNLPSLSTEDLPWLIGTPSARKGRFKFWLKTMERSRNLKWLLMNSFSNQENNLKEKTKPFIFHLGSLGSKTETIIKNPSFWEEDMSSLSWLNTQNPNSVIYISFGSWVSPIGEGKIRSLALTLEAINKPFIWVLGQTWREGLPEGYIKRISKQGKIVLWAPQVEILRNKAVGIYLTHCGWNSTMEAIQCKKRLLCYPVVGDQFVNCAYIVEKWKIGVRINGFDKKNVEEKLKNVMGDNEMESRLMNLHAKMMGDEAKLRAMTNLNTFVDDLKRE